MSFPTFAKTDRGRLRSKNEDALLARPDAGLFVVADGMGGHAAGEVASALAVETLERLAGRDPDTATLADAIRDANAAIIGRTRENHELEGMGTTCTALLLRRDGYTIAHVGDSRAYLMRDGALRRVTVDHTWVQQQVELGSLTESQARHHPWSSMLTRALGIEHEVEVDVMEGDTAPGDVFLLCSDGLTAVLTDDDIADTLRAPTPLDTRGQALIDAALDGGGPDNITVVLVEVA